MAEEDVVGGVGMAEVVRLLLEDRRARDEELKEERRQREEEMTLRAREAEQRAKEMQEQMALLREALGTTHERNRPARDRRVITGLETVKLSKLTESDDIEAYLTTFERMMVANEVERNRWAFLLAPQLTGRAQQAYAATRTEDAGKYDELKTIILWWYDINEETYRQRFPSAKLEKGKTPRELATRLDDLASEWLRECGTVQEVRDVVVKEQLLGVLPEELRVWVRERKPASSAEAGQLAENYLQARRLTTGEGKVEQAKKPERQTVEVRRCHTCGQVGHLARDCRKSGKAGREETSQQERGGRDGVRCFNCHRIGHVAAKCPYSTTMFCEVRGRKSEWQHSEWQRSKVSRKGMVEGVAVDDILLDTGSARTLVKRDLVPDLKVGDGEIAIRCAHGDIATYPLASVRLELGGKSL